MRAIDVIARRSLLSLATDRVNPASAAGSKDRQKALFGAGQDLGFISFAPQCEGPDQGRRTKIFEPVR